MTRGGTGRKTGGTDGRGRRDARAALAGAACLTALLLLPFLLHADMADQAHAQMADSAGDLRDYGDTVAVLETDMGEMVIEFFPDDAPNHVSNFVGLAESGFYDGTVFHRIIPGFMIQGGDPNTVSGPSSTWGMGGPPHEVNAEFNDIEHDRGIVSMARSQNPNSAGSQFFIVHQDSNFLDGQYTVFGRIITESSFETLDKIAATPTGMRDAPLDAEQVRVHTITITERSEVSGVLDLEPPERADEVPPAFVPPAGEEQLYDNKELGISFMAPPNWFLQEPGRTTPGAPDVVAVGQSRGGSTPQIYIFVVDNSNGTALSEIVDSRIELIRSVVSEENFATFSQEEATVAGLPAHRLSITEAVNTGNRTVDVQLVEMIVFGGQKYYMLSYANIPANFEADMVHFERLLETFEAEGITDDATQQEQEQQPADAQEAGEEAKDDGMDDAGSGAGTQAEAAVAVATEEGGGGCLIATAAFGSELEPRVQFLRELRDGTVASTQSGAAFMSAFNAAYYSFSPAVADMEREHPAVRDAVRTLITPMVASLYIMDMADPGSELDVIMYGSIVIMLNAGLYVAAPLAAATLLFAHARRAMAKAGTAAGPVTDRL